MLPVLCIFALTYILIFSLPEHQWLVAAGSALCLVAGGFLSPMSAILAIDTNILLMLCGIMGLAALFSDSQMPAFLAEKLIAICPNYRFAMTALCLFTGFISAFIDNVATVFMVAPVAMLIAKKCGQSPVPAVIAVSVSSNLQGAATLVGDTTSFLLGSYTNMDFSDFFYMQGKPGIFFAVQLGTLATIPVLLSIFYNSASFYPQRGFTTTKVKSCIPFLFLLNTIALLVFTSAVIGVTGTLNGEICLGMFLLCAATYCTTQKSLLPLWNSIKQIEWTTLILLSSLFVIIEALSQNQVIAAATALFCRLCTNNLTGAVTAIILFSVLCSAFIDNIPFVAAMLPITTSLAGSMGLSPIPLCFSLLIGATLGGNLTPIGASANIAGIGLLRTGGYHVKTQDFLKIGIPMTLAATLAGYIFILKVWC